MRIAGAAPFGRRNGLLPSHSGRRVQDPPRHVRTVDLVKVDIEGAEVELFQSPTWVDRVRSLVIETHDHLRPGCTAAAETAMQGFQNTDHNGIRLFIRKNGMQRLAVSPSSPTRNCA